MLTFKEFVAKIEENETSGLIQIRPLPKLPGRTGPPVIQSRDTGTEKILRFISRIALSFPGSAFRALVNFATTLKHMGFTGNPTPLKAALGLGKLAIPPIIYTIAKFSGIAVPELVTILASPQFWEAHQRLGQVEKQGSVGPMFKETIGKMFVV